MSGVERVRVGDVLRLERRRVEIDPIAEYSLIGVYSFGKGIFHRVPVAGADLGNYRFNRVESGDLVLSNIQSWEGAIAYATAEEAGKVGTNRFLTYVPRDDRVDTNWARWFFLSEPGMRLIRQAAPGTVKRNRTLAISRFEALEIPLPPIGEQRSVARGLDRVEASLGALTESSRISMAQTDSLFNSAEWALINDGIQSGWPIVKLATAATVNPRKSSLVPSETTFVPMASVDEERGVIARPIARPSNDVHKGYKQFQRGDVIFARITPCMQNGKAAVFNGPTPIGYGSTEFHVIRPLTGISSSWIHRYLRSDRIRREAMRSMTGTAGQQRVPAKYLANLTIPVPSMVDQVRTTARIDALMDERETCQLMFTRRRGVVEAVLPSAMNRAFAHLS